MIWFHFYEVPRVGKFTETESRVVITSKLGGEGSKGLLFNECKVSVWDDEKILEMNSGDSCTTLNVLTATNCTLKIVKWKILCVLPQIF